MPITNPAQATQFNADYDRLGDYVQDDSQVPYYNPSDSGVLIQPGEPIVVQFGATNAEYVFWAQEAIRPGEISMVTRYNTVDVPCDISADTVLGTEVHWDIDNDVASLVGDITNGFLLGYISYPLPPEPQPWIPTVDGNDRVICATSASTVCRVIMINGATTITGTVVNL